MELPRNPFKAAIKAGHQQIGVWSTIGNSTVAEILAGCGFDWILFDTEHSPIDAVSILPLLQAVEPYPVHPIVRPGSLDLAEIKKLLDFGAQTLLIPFIQNADEARVAAASVAYPPEGVRGVAGFTRASRFGTISGYHKKARSEICLIVQVETVNALDELENIASVPGIDAIFIGPADLAASMGYAGEPAHPEVKKACLDAIRRVRKAGLPAGFLTADQTYIAEVIEAGSLFTAVGVDAALLRAGATDRTIHWRKK